MDMIATSFDIAMVLLTKTRFRCASFYFTVWPEVWGACPPHPPCGGLWPPRPAAAAAKSVTRLRTLPKGAVRSGAGAGCDRRDLPAGVGDRADQQEDHGRGDGACGLAAHEVKYAGAAH